MAQRVDRGIALPFLDRCIRRWWVDSSTPWPHFTPGKDPVPIAQKAGYYAFIYVCVCISLYIYTYLWICTNIYVYYRKYICTLRTRSGAVGWDTAIPAGRSPVQFPMVSMDFSLTLPVTLWPWVDSASNINEYQEYFLGDKGDRCVGMKHLPTSCPDCLEIWEEPRPPGTQGPAQACTGIALPFRSILYSLTKTWKSWGI